MEWYIWLFIGLGAIATIIGIVFAVMKKPTTPAVIVTVGDATVPINGNTWAIVNQMSGDPMDVVPVSHEVDTAAASGGTTQQWLFTATESSDEYYITNRGNGETLTAGDDGPSLVTSEYSGSAIQRWTLTPRTSVDGTECYSLAHNKQTSYGIFTGWPEGSKAIVNAAGATWGGGTPWGDRFLWYLRRVI